MTFLMATTFGPMLFIMLVATIMSEIRDIKSAQENNTGILQSIMTFSLTLLFIASITAIVISGFA